jgi:hypothetical protein
MEVPDFARNIGVVTAIAELAGEVIVVDEVSLIKDGSIRVKLRARDIDKIRGLLEYFVEGVGYEAKFTPESTKTAKSSNPPPPPDKKPEDDDYNGDKEDDLYDSIDEYKKKMRNAMEGKSDSNQSEKRTRSHKGRQHGDPSLGSDRESRPTPEQAIQAKPIAMFDLNMNLIMKVMSVSGEAEEGVVTTQEDEQLKEGGVDQYVIHTEGGERDT